MNAEQLILGFTSIVYEALPFVVLGVLIAGILEEFVPQEFMSTIFQGKLPDGMQGTVSGAILRPVASLLQFRVIAIFVGGFLGLIFPMCECGIIAIMRRLIRKGVPLSVCVCYMLCGPIINVIVILSTFVAFNYPAEEAQILGGPFIVVLLRVGISFATAVLTSLLVEWMYQREGDALLHPSLIVTRKPTVEVGATKPPIIKRIGNISETALHDFVDIMAFLVLGAALAALGSQVIRGTDVGSYIQSSAPLAIVIMMGIAVLFCLCSEADAFVAANFPQTWAPAAKMAFMVLGPMFDIKLYIMWTRLFKVRLIWIIVGAIVIQIFAYNMILHYLWDQHGYSTEAWRTLTEAKATSS
ncbi:MAG: permease [Gemmataceae bacterium]